MALSPQQSAALEFIRQRGATYAYEIAAGTGIDRRNLPAIINRLRADGLIEYCDPPAAATEVLRGIPSRRQWLRVVKP